MLRFHRIAGESRRKARPGRDPPWAAGGSASPGRLEGLLRVGAGAPMGAVEGLALLPSAAVTECGPLSRTRILIATRTVAQAQSAPWTRPRRSSLASGGRGADDVERQWIHNEPGKDRAVEFPVFLSATVHRDVRLVGTSYEYELVAGEDRAGMISLGPTEFWLAHMACREGDWFLTKHRKLGWGFVIEAEDRSQVGLYSGGRWRTGGTILMAAGT